MSLFIFMNFLNEKNLATIVDISKSWSVQRSIIMLIKSRTYHAITSFYRKGNAIRSVRIMKWDGKFGILSSHCNFPSVTSLVNHLLKHPESYKIQFPDLDFLHPVLKVTTKCIDMYSYTKLIQSRLFSLWSS